MMPYEGALKHIGSIYPFYPSRKEFIICQLQILLSNCITHSSSPVSFICVCILYWVHRLKCFSNRFFLTEILIWTNSLVLFQLLEHYILNNSTFITTDRASYKIHLPGVIFNQTQMSFYLMYYFFSLDPYDHQTLHWLIFIFHLLLECTVTYEYPVLFPILSKAYRSWLRLSPISEVDGGFVCSVSSWYWCIVKV